RLLWFVSGRGGVPDGPKRARIGVRHVNSSYSGVGVFRAGRALARPAGPSLFYPVTMPGESLVAPLPRTPYIRRYARSEVTTMTMQQVTAPADSVEFTLRFRVHREGSWGSPKSAAGRVGRWCRDYIRAGAGRRAAILKTFREVLTVIDAAGAARVDDEALAAFLSNPAHVLQNERGAVPGESLVRFSLPARAR